jgi:acetolactate decarboxylase
MEKDDVAPWKMFVPVAAVIAMSIMIIAAIYVPTQPESDTLYQVSPFSTFSAGDYDGNTTFAELAERGDFGIGTLNGLDGEMYAVDGTFYQIPTDGHPREIGPSEKTPYATVTFFDVDQTFAVANVSNYSQLKSEIGLILPDHDAIYAIKVVGLFAYAETRSVPVQTKPYPPLADAVANQTIFDLNDVEGTAVGFFFPDSMDGVDSVGYHLHFLTDDRTAGGHLLDCSIIDATVEMERLNDYHLLIT